MIWSRIMGMGPPGDRCGDMVPGCASVRSGAAHIVSPDPSGGCAYTQSLILAVIFASPDLYFLKYREGMVTLFLKNGNGDINDDLSCPYHL
jgi:hypothetical protein